jgi:hypothetical protein
MSRDLRNQRQFDAPLRQSSVMDASFRSVERQACVRLEPPYPGYARELWP